MRKAAVCSEAASDRPQPHELACAPLTPSGSERSVMDGSPRSHQYSLDSLEQSFQFITCHDAEGVDCGAAKGQDHQARYAKGNGV